MAVPKRKTSVSKKKMRKKKLPVMVSKLLSLLKFKFYSDNPAVSDSWSFVAKNLSLVNDTLA